MRSRTLARGDVPGGSARPSPGGSSPWTLRSTPTQRTRRKHTPRLAVDAVDVEGESSRSQNLPHAALRRGPVGCRVQSAKWNWRRRPWPSQNDEYVCPAALSACPSLRDRYGQIGPPVFLASACPRPHHAAQQDVAPHEGRARLPKLLGAVCSGETQTGLVLHALVGRPSQLSFFAWDQR